MEKSQLRSLVCSLLLVGCSGGAELFLPGDGEPATIEVVHGNRQSGRVGEPLTDSLVFQVTDSRGRVIEGVSVAFDVTSAGPGAEVIPTITETNSEGLADTRVVLGTTMGVQTGQARVVTPEGSRPVATTFTATALSENANTMAAVVGQDQIGRVGQPLNDQLVVEVTDRFGNPVPGVPITWTAEGGGSVSQAMVETGEDGRARVDRILGPTVGQQTTVAASEGLAGSPLAFTHTALAGDASILVILSGNGQTAAAGSALPADLVVQLVDADGNGVPSAALSWVVATGGGSAAPANATTDDQGLASTRWTLGQSLGEQRIDAVVSGVGFVSFRAQATAGAPASLFLRTQPSAAAGNGVPFARQPVVQVRDAGGNDVAVAGVQVTAAIGSGGGELSGTRVRATDAAGRAAFADLAISGAAGKRTLVFSATGYAAITSTEIDVAAPPNQLPSASFTFNCVQLNCSFNAGGSSDPDGSVVAWRWNFGDGGEGDGVGPSHGYGTAGTYLVALTVTDDAGATHSVSQSVTVNGPPPPPNEAPDADFTSTCQGLTCQFTDASRDDGTITAWSWGFGGTGTSEQQNPSHTFPGSGRYRVTLTVTDNSSATDSFTATVDVEAPPPANQPPTAEFTWTCNDLKCEFDDQSTDSDGKIERRVWAFGDGGDSDGRDPSHTYAAGGTYTVRLTVTDNDDATATVEHAVTVVAPNQKPSAEFAFTCTDLSCQFTDQSTDSDGTLSWSWDFDDGTGLTDRNPLHTFAQEGTYKVKLTVTDDDGASDSIDHDVKVTAPPQPNQAPTASFTESCSDLTCSFDASGSNDPEGGIQNQSWDFGDGNSGTGVNPSHAYASEGSYSVTLTVTDAQGAQGSVTRVITVAAPAGVRRLGLRTEPASNTRSGVRLNPEPQVELRRAAGGEIKDEGVEMIQRLARDGHASLDSPPESRAISSAG